MIEEIWKDIPNYEGHYKISNLGRIKSIKYNKEKIISILNTGKYNHVMLYRNNINKNFTIHKLVAMTFIPNPNNYSEINHKDENTRNNCVDNLEWCNHTYNINYKNRTKKAKEKLSIKVNQYDLNDNLIKTWDCMNDAIRFYKNVHICDVCKGKRNVANGYKWSYYDKKFRG